MTDVLQVGLTQWHPTRDVAANVDVACRHIAACAADGATLVVLPENGLMLGTNTEMRAAALRADGAELGELAAATAAAGVTTVMGGIKRIGADGVVRNSALVLAPDGTLAGSYDKIHLFDATVGGQSFEASGVEQRGERASLVEVDGVLAGLTICYDVRFPELFRLLALAGAEVLLVPAAFTRVTGTAHWEPLLRARAIENACFVVASATIGNEPDDAFPTYGHALVVDPWGEVLADLGEAEDAHTVVALDLTRVRSIRHRLPVLAGVQPAAYTREPATIVVREGSNS